uniref:Uncharacterized protein n=1 Tax=Cyprinodon variegatus TaxID=28743 RepID=A0A3Q2DGT6_CYPVA
DISKNGPKIVCPIIQIAFTGKHREKEQQRERVKERDREAKEKVCRTGSHSNSNGHYLIPGSFSSSATCSLCSKSLQKKHGLRVFIKQMGSGIFHKPQRNHTCDKYGRGLGPLKKKKS